MAIGFDFRIGSVVAQGDFIMKTCNDLPEDLKSIHRKTLDPDFQFKYYENAVKLNNTRKE